jgi:hypothetical protein
MNLYPASLLEVSEVCLIPTCALCASVVNFCRFFADPNAGRGGMNSRTHYSNSCYWTDYIKANLDWENDQGATFVAVAILSDVGPGLHALDRIQALGGWTHN